MIICSGLVVVTDVPVQEATAGARIGRVKRIKLGDFGVDEMIQVGLKIQTFAAPLVRKGEHGLDRTSVSRCRQRLLAGGAVRGEGGVG